MFIDSIILENFRVYKGRNEISLSKTKDHQLTVIAGNNGFGKTSFLTGLVWGLYGKLMADVDQRYREEIAESGGYRKYCEKLMNRLAVEEQSIGWHPSASEAGSEELAFSVTIRFSELLIPSVLCEQVEVKRTYYPNSGRESVIILIDGIANELTKGVGPEIFINDFILPKEIAKFFFFDAEKIVSLSEIKTADEKKYLSQAYAEVLGIKKYTDLKYNLENVRLRLRDRSTNRSDRAKLGRLQGQQSKNEKLIELYREEIQEKTETLFQKRLASDRYQEQLIREGSGMTMEELKNLREQQHDLQNELAKAKSLFAELLELAPFAIAAGKLKQVIAQLEAENSSSVLLTTLMNGKVNAISKALQSSSDSLGLAVEQYQQVMKVIKANLISSEQTPTKALLDFNVDLQNRFIATFGYLSNAYSKTFRKQVADQRRLQSGFSTVQKKLRDAESKEKDPVVSAIRKTKLSNDHAVGQLENELEQLQNKIILLQNENQSLSRQISELTKHVKVEALDAQKDIAAERVISKLDQFILNLKSQKKKSLESNILQELRRLMHKQNFVSKVNVLIDGELIDIELFDQQGKHLDKELFSKGEQQLYASALLAALIAESNIRFPVFIDSPLQKFDKTHSRNIITEFYPYISEQIVLFPLLEKELNEQEYQWMLPLVGKSYLIAQTGKYHSSFALVQPEELFNAYQTSLTHVQ